MLSVTSVSYTHLTGVDHLTILNLKVDTNRDGLDIDCCRNVRISQCTVNSPWDDAIVLKASYGLGRFQDTENVTISDCYVSGFDKGSVMDGTWQLDEPQAPDHGFRTGRIKLVTETVSYTHLKSYTKDSPDELKPKIN